MLTAMARMLKLIMDLTMDLAADLIGDAGSRWMLQNAEPVIKKPLRNTA